MLTQLAVTPACNFELPGHGDAPLAEFDLDALADACAAQAPAQCAVLAWSLGAQVALRWAQRHPQQVRRLVLVSATPCFGQRGDWPHGSSAAVQQAFAAQVAADPARALPRFADLMAEGEADPRAARKTLRALLAEKPLPSVAALLDGLEFLERVDLRAALRAAPPQQPALIMHGEDDTITPVAAGRWLADILPHARWLALPHCGHAPLLTHAAEAGAAIHKFLHD